MSAIKITNLRKRYGTLQAVKGISFSVEKGDFFGFIGPNGAGKTTTIKSIMGLLKYQGRITVMGYDVVNDYEMARTKVGLSPQEFNFDRFLTVEEELFYTGGFYGMRKADILPRREKLLKQFNLLDKRKKRIETLSGGMKRRLIIARALIHQPDILILDEPTAGLDVELRRELWKQLQEINKNGTTIILTSHYLEEIELLCNTVGIINNGKILEMGKKEEMMEKLSNQTLKLKTNKKIPPKLLATKKFSIHQEGNVTKVTGKGIRKQASAMIEKVKRAKFTIEEIDIYRESLEEVFIRLTGGQRG